MNTALMEFLFDPNWPQPTPSTGSPWIGTHLTNRIRWEGFRMAAAMLFAILLYRVT